MGIKITKKVDFTKLINKIKNIDERIVSVATDLIVGIANRTQTGMDYKGGMFKSYPASYREYRVSKGRSAKPNLTFNNQMLNAMRFKKIKDGGMIYFPDSVENEKAYSNHEKKGREFFGLDTNQEKYIISSIGKYISQGFK